MQKNISEQNIIIINNIQPYLYAWKQHIFGRYITDVDDNVFCGGDSAVADDDIDYYGKKKLKLILLVTKSNLE